MPGHECRANEDQSPAGAQANCLVRVASINFSRDKMPKVDHELEVAVAAID